MSNTPSRERFAKGVKVRAMLHHSVCYALLTANLVFLTAKYMSYETNIAVGFHTPVDAPYPNLSLCFNLNTILGGYEIETFDDHKAQFLDLTTREIMDRVPAVREVLTACSIRDPLSDRIIHIDSAVECLKIFRIQRHRMHSTMCYLF